MSGFWSFQLKRLSSGEIERRIHPPKPHPEKSPAYTQQGNPQRVSCFQCATGLLYLLAPKPSPRVLSIGRPH